MSETANPVNWLRVKRGEMKMLHDRGYILTRQEDALRQHEGPITKPMVDAFKAELSALSQQHMVEDVPIPFYRAMDTVHVHKKTGQRMLIYHIFDKENKQISLELTQKFIEVVKLHAPHHLNDQDEPYHHVLGVIMSEKDSLTPTAKRTLQIAKIPGFVTGYAFFLVTPTEHVLTPKYRHVHDAEEIKRILEGTRLNASNLPLMLKSDPIAVYYGASKGDLFIEETDASFLNQIASTQTLLRMVN